MTQSDTTESKAGGCGTWFVYFVLLSLTGKGIQQLPWPTWLRIAVFLVCWVVISGLVYGAQRKPQASQVPPGRPGPLSAGAEAEPSDNRPGRGPDATSLQDRDSGPGETQGHA